MTWDDYVKASRDVAYQQWREERAREFAEIVRLMRGNIERNIAGFSAYREIPALSVWGAPPDGEITGSSFGHRPITIEDAYQMVRALTKLKHLPDFGIVL